MPPKSALVAAVMGDTIPSTQPSTKKQPKASAPRSTTTKSSKAKPPARASKKTSLPPPSENTSTPVPKRNTRKKASTLPKENQWGSTAPISKNPLPQSSQAKGGVKNKSALQQKSLVKKKQAIPKMMQQLNEQSRQAGWSNEKFTERWMSLKTKRVKDAENLRKMRERSGPKKVLELLRKGKKQERTEEMWTFNWNGLTTEIQKRIIRHLVVDPRFLVWPEKRIGREQPDLSLVSREMREQILEAFYGESTFGVSITGSLVGKEDCSLTGLAAVNKWATFLEPKWFGMIRNWCFEYEDPEASGAKIRKSASSFDDEDEDESFVVSVQFPERGKEQKVSFSGPTVEIHRAACCVLPGSEEFGQCVVQHTPMSLNGLIIGAMGEGQRLQADALEGLVKALRGRDLIELVAEARCEPAMVKMRKRRGAISV